MYKAALGVTSIGRREALEIQLLAKKNLEPHPPFENFAIFITKLFLIFQIPLHPISPKTSLILSIECTLKQSSYLQ